MNISNYTSFGEKDYGNECVRYTKGYRKTKKLQMQYVDMAKRIEYEGKIMI